MPSQRRDDECIYYTITIRMEQKLKLLVIYGITAEHSPVPIMIKKLSICIPRDLAFPHPSE